MKQEILFLSLPRSSAEANEAMCIITLLRLEDQKNVLNAFRNLRRARSLVPCATAVDARGCSRTEYRSVDTLTVAANHFVRLAITGSAEREIFVREIATVVVAIADIQAVDAIPASGTFRLASFAPKRL